ncbi:phosphatase PAP2 family protein [uncultured Eudoraea sp.]|uniref:phosphatase PAP2 family protein n=1 Tax=uncultured Eudoraea sp. TaxID=1035614 RepID=UPI0026368D91|nr:phosphatase PAP2 family protein [uncultured Eudoraea sp.]
MLRHLLEWDRNTFIYLNNLGTEDYDLFWVIVTNITSWIPLYILLLALIFLKYPKKEALFISCTIVLLLICILGLTDIVKTYFERLRPNNDIEINSIIRILKNPAGYSFFSGHASSSFSLTTISFLFLRKKVSIIWLLFIWPFLFAYSRIYVGVHYPLDLITGALIGMLLGFLFYLFYRRFIEPYIM